MSEKPGCPRGSSCVTGPSSGKTFFGTLFTSGPASGGPSRRTKDEVATVGWKDGSGVCGTGLRRSGALVPQDPPGGRRRPDGRGGTGRARIQGKARVPGEGRHERGRRPRGRFRW